MKTTYTTLLAAAALAIGFTGAHANESGPRIFEHWDANKDGTITVTEVESRRGDIFTSFDANSDGFLVEEETRLMDEMRENQQEMNAEDGGQKHMGGAMGQGHGKHGMGHGMGSGMGKHKGQGMNNDPGHGSDGHMGFDADKDGKVSKAEFIGQSKDWLAKFDRDGDGSVKKADFGL